MTIKNNCRKATFMLEKKLSDRISFVEKLELNIHLAGCADCRLYRKQSRYIHELMTNLYPYTNEADPELGEDFKRELNKTIIARTESENDQNFL